MDPANGPLKDAAPLSLVMDVDTGIDDALALALALRSPGVEVVAISTVAGNIGAAQAATNTLKVLDALGATVPVAIGLTGPLLRAFRAAPAVHGEDGMGDARLPEPKGVPTGEHGVDQIIRLAREHPGELTLFTSGPLSNVAAALMKEPELPRLYKRLVMMGGAVGVPGNVSPVAEANIFNDPEAAGRVLEAGWASLTMVGLDVTMATRLTGADLERLRTSAVPAARLVAAIAPFYVRRYEGLLGPGMGCALHDPLALGIALDPSLVTTMAHLDIQIEIVSPLTLGMTVADRRPLLGPGYAPPRRPILTPLAVDAPRFVDRFLAALLS